MRSIHTSALVAIAFAGGCVSQAQSTPPAYGESEPYAGMSTGPTDESYGWAGPPGGAIDPGFGYDDPSLARSPWGQSPDPTDPSVYGGAYGGAMYGGAMYGDPNAATTSGGDPAVWAGATAEVTDAEIDVTLDAYGEWVEDGDYGRVWRPYTTVVGADFTPYESCGSWVFTDYGWTFQSCDAWSWGWLPFHFGRWVYLDNSWCWSRDYTWGPGWVEWRHGGDYVGWRPMRPTYVRDRNGPRAIGSRVRDHRDGKRDEWRFHNSEDFRQGRMRPLAIGAKEGLRVTNAVAQPPLRVDFRARASSVMAGRLRDHQRGGARTRGTGAMGQSTRGYEPSRGTNVGGPTRGYNSIGTRAPNVGGPTRGYNAPNRGYNPTYNPSIVSPDRNRPTWNRSNSGYRAPPSTSGDGYRYNGPSTRTPPSTSGNGYGYRTPPSNYNPPSRTYSGPTRNYNAPTPPSRTYSGPTRNYNAPSPPSRTYSGPTRNYNAPSPPSRSYSGPTRGYSAPSRPSSVSGPSRSYSAPSRSSSAPSRSSSSYSSPSSSSRGSSSSSSSSSRSSGGGSRGGRGR